MTRFHRILPLLILAAAGCTTLRVEHEAIDDSDANPDRGSLVVKALRVLEPEKYSGGYLFSIERGETYAAVYETSASGPTAIRDLVPGRYQIAVSGRHIHPVTTEVEVRKGQRTDVVLWVRGARNATMLEGAAAIAGKGVVTTLLLPVHALLLKPSHGTSDDPCARNDQNPVFNLPKERKTELHPGAVGNYRKKKKGPRASPAALSELRRSYFFSISPRIRSFSAFDFSGSFFLSERRNLSMSS
ncbi:MAG TPA: hypothetical protein VE981_11335 [Planctomycetota bacterium]|nr:hypothetical protein [Planctomycetota bacterium]